MFIVQKLQCTLTVKLRKYENWSKQMPFSSAVSIYSKLIKYFLFLSILIKLIKY